MATLDAFFGDVHLATMNADSRIRLWLVPVFAKHGAASVFTWMEAPVRRIMDLLAVTMGKNG